MDRRRRLRSAPDFINPDGLAFDANGNLFIADDGVPDVVEIPNTGTAGAFVAGTQKTVISSSTLFGGTALANATGLPWDRMAHSTSPIHSRNRRVVFWNPIIGQSGVTLATAAIGLKSSWGIAVDSSSSLYVADLYDERCPHRFASAGAISTITPPNVAQAAGVAVDASGSLLVSDAPTGNIVRVPDFSGTLTTASAITIETIAPQAYAMSLDSQGNLYVGGGHSAKQPTRSNAPRRRSISAPSRMASRTPQRSTS